MELWDTLNDFAKALFGVFLIGLIVGGVILAWINVLGPAFNTAAYSNYQSSPMHVNAVMDKIQNDCDQQLPGTSGETKLAIERDIISQAGQINLDQATRLTNDDRACIAQAKQDIVGTR